MGVYTRFKQGVAIEDIMSLDPILGMIVFEASNYYRCFGFGFVITSLTEGFHTTDTHIEGRGCDIRIWGVSKVNREQLCRHLNKKYGELFGTGPGEDVAPKVAVIESDHIHLQVRRGINIALF